MKANKTGNIIYRLLLATPFRISIVYVSLFCGAVALTFIYVYVNVQEFIERDTTRSIENSTAHLVDTYTNGKLQKLLNEIAERVTSPETGLFLLTDAKGTRLAGNLETVSTELWDTQGTAYFQYRLPDKPTDVSSPALGLVTRLPGGLHLIVAQNIDQQENLRHLMRGAFIVGYGIIALIGVIGGVFMSHRILSRVDEASNAAKAIMNGNMDERITVSERHDEFDRLSVNLNAMLDRIQALMTGLRDVSDNIAHDLKTPLHRLRTRAEHALQTGHDKNQHADALAAVIEDADGLIQIFDALLNIARLEAGSRSDSYGVVDLSLLLHDVTELYEPVAEEAGLTLNLKLPSHQVTIFGEKHLLGQALANLLDNAIKYGAPSDDKRVLLADSNILNLIEIGLDEKDDHIDLVIADHGPGIPEQDRERVLQRFVRLQPSRSIPGSGLGLSLVTAVAHLHNAAISLEDNAPGLRIKLQLKRDMQLKATGAIS